MPAGRDPAQACHDPRVAGAIPPPEGDRRRQSRADRSAAHGRDGRDGPHPGRIESLIDNAGPASVL
jgi:hypothetical protein